MRPPSGQAIVDEALRRAADGGADVALAWLDTLAPSDHGWANLARARIFRRQGLGPEALEAYRAVVFGPALVEATVMMEFAAMAVEMFALDEARIVYRELLCRPGVSAAGALGLWRLDCLAVGSRARHRVDTRPLRAGLVLEPAEPSLWYELGSFEIKRGAWEAGVRALWRTGSAYTGQSRLWRRLTTGYVAREAWGRAATAARRAVLLAPQVDGEVWAQLCAALVGLREPARAQRALAAVRVLHPSAVADLGPRVELLTAEQDRRVRLHRMRRDLLTDPGDGPAWLRLARVALALGKRKLARRADRCLRLFPALAVKRARLWLDGGGEGDGDHVAEAARILLILGAVECKAMPAAMSDAARRGAPDSAALWARAILCCLPAAAELRAAATVLRGAGMSKSGIPALCRAAAAAPRDGELRMALAELVGGVVRAEHSFSYGVPLGRPRIIDCFCFNNEHRLLAARLELLYAHVDRFVLVEAPRTFTGTSKPLHFADNRGLYARFLDKIFHVVADPPEIMSEPWARDFYQRDSILAGLVGYAAADDFVVVADVDELWDPAVVSGFRGDFAALRMRLAQGRVNHRPVFGKRVAYDTGVISRFRVLAHLSPSVLRFDIARQRARVAGEWIDDAGWHLTSVGDIEQVSGKLASYAHQEPAKRRWFTREVIAERLDRLANGIPDEDWVLFDADPRWPKAVRKALKAKSIWQPPRADMLSAALLDVADAVDRLAGRRAADGPGRLKILRSAQMPGGLDARAAGRPSRERLAVDPGDRVARLTVATEARQAGRLDEAVRVIEAGLRRDPLDVDLLAQRGFLLLWMGHVAVAAGNLRRALLVSPAETKVRRRLVICHDRLMDRAGAERELARLATSSPDQWDFEADMRARWGQSAAPA